MRSAFASGYENLSAWADLLDRINVFPVADGDTGANLRLSLAPLRDHEADRAETRNLLARCAIGNSGNIAAAFFQEFYLANRFDDLAENAARGREKAWQALAKPQTGTMLNVFDRLAVTLAGQHDPIPLYPLLCAELQDVVIATSQTLPDLRQAGVVDAGALGMYTFFEGFFRQLAGQPATPPSIPKLFAGKLAISADFQANSTDCYCVSALIHTGDNQTGTDKILPEWGESVVVLPAESGIKVHIHTADRQQLRDQLSSLGEIVDWFDEAMDKENSARFTGPEKKQVIHIVTDGAGSLTREMAKRHGITRLDSYILAQGRSQPESLCLPEEIYALMRKGIRVSTAQASIFERHQHYQSVCQQFGPTLYLCVGAAFTGNYAVANHWKHNDSGGADLSHLLEIIDTGAASGRLGLIALLAARCSEHAATPNEVVDFTRKIIATCEEYVFIDTLQYLVAGGRVSRAGGFFADLLHMKPVITPTNAGVRKVGIVHSKEGQLHFAMEKLRAIQGTAPVVLLQYTDNEPWVTATVLPRVCELLPDAEILLAPLSLTSGVHMGPGTWSIAWAGGQTQ